MLFTVEIGGGGGGGGQVKIFHRVVYCEHFLSISLFELCNVEQCVHFDKTCTSCSMKRKRERERERESAPQQSK